MSYFLRAFLFFCISPFLIASDRCPEFTFQQVKAPSIDNLELSLSADSTSSFLVQKSSLLKCRTPLLQLTCALEEAAYNQEFAATKERVLLIRQQDLIALCTYLEHYMDEVNKSEQGGLKQAVESCFDVYELRGLLYGQRVRRSCHLAVDDTQEPADFDSASQELKHLLVNLYEQVIACEQAAACNGLYAENGTPRIQIFSSLLRSSLSATGASRGILRGLASKQLANQATESQFLAAHIACQLVKTIAAVHQLAEDAFSSSSPRKKLSLQALLCVKQESTQGAERLSNLLNQMNQ